MALCPTYKPVKHRLYDIFQAWLLAEVNSLGVAVDNEEIFTNNQIFDEMSMNYSSFFWTTTAPQFDMQFLDLWHNYVRDTGAQLKKLYDGLNLTYNPIENYSLHETGLDGIRRAGETRTDTPTGTTTTTRDLNKYAIDSGANGAPSDKETTTTSFTDREDTTETTPGNDQPGNYDGQEYGQYNEAREHIFDRSGNIGTMTPADMLKKDAEIRSEAAFLLRDYVAAFINRYCYYVGCEYYDDQSL